MDTVKSFNDFAEFLGIPAKSLSYILYVLKPNNLYTKFTIPKKSGGVREISKPHPALLAVQNKFKAKLEEYYVQRNCSHGFEHKRNCLTNAKAHPKREILLNVDLEGFFNSINFGRVYGLFLHSPFDFGEKAAAAAATLVSYNNALPQGAPTSPILSNMICKTLDGRMQKLCTEEKAKYSRYVDDITISTNNEKFSKNLAIENSTAIELGAKLIAAITSNGFKINDKKTRINHKWQRQEVTGITVNEFPNVKREYVNATLGMLYSWKRFELTNAAKVYAEKYQKRPRKISGEKLYRAVVIGRITYIAQVRGWHDVVVRKLCRKFCECDANPPQKIGVFGNMPQKFNVFIGHASEQRDSVAIPLYKSLQNVGVKSFIDVEKIKWGSSLTKIINSALVDCEYFLAIISVNSITKDWPDAEINSAIAREINKKQIILPLFVGSPTEIETAKERYPLIAHKFYKVWNDNPDELALDIKSLITP